MENLVHSCLSRLKNMVLRTSACALGRLRCNPIRDRAKGLEMNVFFSCSFLSQSLNLGGEHETKQEGSCSGLKRNIILGLRFPTMQAPRHQGSKQNPNSEWSTSNSCNTVRLRGMETPPNAGETGKLDGIFKFSDCLFFFSKKDLLE